MITHSYEKWLILSAMIVTLAIFAGGIIVWMVQTPTEDGRRARECAAVCDPLDHRVADRVCRCANGTVTVLP